MMVTDDCDKSINHNKGMVYKKPNVRLASSNKHKRKPTHSRIDDLFAFRLLNPLRLA